MDAVWTALAIILILEGMAYATLSKAWREQMAMLILDDRRRLRAVGLGAVTLGLLILWQVHG